MYNPDYRPDYRPGVNNQPGGPPDPYVQRPLTPPPGEYYQQPTAASEQYGPLPEQSPLPDQYGPPPAQSPLPGQYTQAPEQGPLSGQSGQYTQAPEHSPLPGQYIQAPATAPATTRRGSSGVGRAVIITLLLAALLGGLLFAAGWQFGRGSATTSPNSSGLQSGQSPNVTVPTLNSNNIQAVREAVVAKIRPTVVQINVALQGGKEAIGSGVIIDARGYIITNNHVVDGAQSIQVALYDGTRLPGKVKGTDPADDLAVVQITPPAKMVVATVGDSSQLQVGQEVLAVGNPLGNTQTVTNGIVSALGRNVSEGPGGATIPNAIQTDAPINPGNSGGALVDLQGNLVGIPTLTAIDPEFNTPANGVGFAIPSNRVKIIAPQIIDTGTVTHTGRAALGVMVASVDSVLASQDNLSVDHGSLITQLLPNSAAAQAGLHVGDVIVQIDNTPVNDNQSLGDALSAKNPGDTVAVKIYRGSQQLTINVKLGELQAS